MGFAAFRTKIIAKQENARDRRQLPVSEHNFPTCSTRREALFALGSQSRRKYWQFCSAI
jgi:hypothetical protein